MSGEGKANIVVGGQFGDEGKGKIISYLALKDNYAAIARAGVGPNAGHSVKYKGKKHGIRIIPSGFVNERARLYVGAGVLIDIKVFFEEIRETGVENRVKVDERCGIIEDKHREADRSSSYLKSKIGTTGTGCGPANAERAMRKLKLAKDFEELKEYACDVSFELNNILDAGKSVLIEMTQGFGLSLYYGTYPFVTSKDTTASTALADVGIGPKRAGDVIVVFKSFPTRVGSGPFETELSEEEAEKLGIVEYGTVTGRKRRIGIFDFELAKRACRINSATQVAITCIDYIDKSCYGIKEYSKLSKAARDFIEKVEKELKLPVTIISTGPEPEHTIDLRKEK